MKLTEHLPRFWEATPEMTVIQDAMTPCVEQAWRDYDDLLAQINVQTATWGLSLWEKMLDITDGAGNLPEDRRARIMARLMGQGTTTPQMLVAIAGNYYAGEARVVERPADYSFTIELSGPLELPVNWEGLKSAIDEAIPAHLAYDYTFVYQTGTLPIMVGCFVHMGDYMTINMTN